jgi:L-seryl-tRNA(Ser) seleniumtransferase
LSDALRRLPSVNEALERLSPRLRCLPQALLVAEIRRVLDAVRAEIRAGDEHSSGVDERIEQAVDALLRPSQRRVINATGVVLHTNLGRAPLGEIAFEAGYSNLEYDLATGRRGKRDAHTASLIERLLGSPGIVVNNNAAAVFLALHELAAGCEVVVSRGELIEIGDGFRIPEIMSRSGAQLKEVGTTNRTSVEDYRAAINERTRLLLRVHPSNFRMEGFTLRPSVEELATLAQERGIPLYEDLGSGCLADLREYGIDEPLAQDSLRAGADLISFSGDKLLGGPQAGILAGKHDLVARLRRNPLFRALRADKLIYHSLETTLRNILLQKWDAIPALRMIRCSAESMRARAEQLLEQIPGELIQGQSVIGGGSTPGQALPSWLIALDVSDAARAEHRLRQGDPPVIVRIDKDRLLIDLRTVFPEEDGDLTAAVKAAL